MSATYVELKTRAPMTADATIDDAKAFAREAIRDHERDLGEDVVAVTLVAGERRLELGPRAIEELRR